MKDFLVQGKIENIGIVGQGFVGTAVLEGLNNFYSVETYDKIRNKSTCSSLFELCEKVKHIFVCLPTPMNKDGSCNLNIIKSVLEEINSHGPEFLIILKSTIPPGTTTLFNNEYSNLNIVFNPEFLTEANFIDDFKNQSRIIIGGPRPYSSIVKTIYRKAFPQSSIIKTGSNTAEMVKYFTNCFLATKVSFANEIKQLCDVADIDYDKVVEYALYDNRLGKSHWSVPGTDSKQGFGGSCFPKDINALIHFGKERKIDLNVLIGAWKTNLTVRPEKDWENLKGRAVIE